jgi:hypothetical protein
MILMPAVQALKPIPATVSTIHETTTGTGLRTIGRIDLLMTETFRQRLEFDAILQFAAHERPTSGD